MSEELPFVEAMNSGDFDNIPQMSMSQGPVPARLAVFRQDCHKLNVVLACFGQQQEFTKKVREDGKTDFQWSLERDADWMVSEFENFASGIQMAILNSILRVPDLDNQEKHSHLWNFFPKVPQRENFWTIYGAILKEHKDLSLHLFSVLGQQLDGPEVVHLAETAIEKKNHPFLQAILPRMDHDHFRIFPSIAKSNDEQLLRIFLECPGSRLVKRDIRSLCFSEVNKLMLTTVLENGFKLCPSFDVQLPEGTHLSKWKAFIESGFFADREKTMVRDTRQVQLLAFLAVGTIRRHLVSTRDQTLNVLCKRLPVPKVVQEEIWKPFTIAQIRHIANNS